VELNLVATGALVTAGVAMFAVLVRKRVI
jgi:hypothetical protein